MLEQGCWSAHAPLLQAQGVSQEQLRQTWQAVCANARSCCQLGRGLKIPGLCTILPQQQQQQHGGVKLLLSEQLLRSAPQLQLGRGCMHASVKQQVQRVETLNTARLAHQFAHSQLSQDSIKLALRCLVGTVSTQAARRLSCTVELGVGQLRIAAGGRVAEFIAHSSWQGSATTLSPVTAATAAAGGEAAPAACAGQHDPHHSSSGCSSVSKHSSSSLSAAKPAAPAAVASSLQDKPCNAHYDAVAAWEIAREVRTAAAGNKRAKPATFVLPAGGPGDDDDLGSGHHGQPHRMPQGKGRGLAEPSFGQMQVLAAAAERLQQEEAERQAAEAACLKQQAARLSVLNLQAQEAKQCNSAQKQRLAADLAAQIKAKRLPSKLVGEEEQPLVVSSKPDTEAIRAQRAQQQKDYRAYLDAQTAKGGKQGDGASSALEQELEQHHRRLLQAALVDG